MDFLGIGPLELMFVILIALIVIGPKDMSKTARTAGRTLNRMYRSEAWRSLTQASRTLQTLPNRLAREAQLEELEELRKDLDNKPQPDLAQNPSLKPWVTPYDSPEKFQTIAPPAHAQAAKPKTAQPARTKPPATTAGKPSASKKSGAGKSTKRNKKPSSGPKKGTTPSGKSGGAKPKASSPTPPRSSTSGRSSSSRSKPTGRSGH